MNRGQIIQFNAQELKEMMKVLDSLPYEFNTRRRRSILRKGVKSFIQRAKTNAPVDSGILKNNIGTKAFRNNKNSLYAGVVLKGNAKDKMGRAKDGWYARLIEYGFTQISWPDKSKKKTDYPASRKIRIQPKPFLRPAWEATKNQVFKETIESANKSLKRWMKKIAR